MRTPYGRHSLRGVVRGFARRGYHVVVESLRGTDGSGGAFVGFTLVSADAAAVAAWLRAQPWYPGTIITWGSSAMGYAQWALAALDLPDWRLAVIQDAPSLIYHGLAYPGGAFAAAVMLGWVEGVTWAKRHPRASLPRIILAAMRGARRTKRVLRELPLAQADQRLLGHEVAYYQDWLRHETPDAFWQAMNQRRHVAGMPPQVHLATGWYDVCLANTLADYAALREAGRAVRLVVGPWTHLRGSRDKDYTREVDACFEAAARGEHALADSAVRLYVAGAGVWREFSDWPPPGYSPITWHAQPGGALATTPAPDSPPDRYRYDPADPTPALGGNVENWDGAAGPKDNRPLEGRADVLTYTSGPLAADHEVIGSANAVIVLRSSRAHTDLFVRLCDVAPNGRSTNVCDGVRRLRPDDPPAATDGARRVEIDLLPTAYLFRRGHRLRLLVASGAHPRFARNPGTDAPLATATELQAADQEIFHDPAHPSTLTLPTRPLAED
jgi:putative CocE/NonD family hydrolase